jgi:hypothetical protein
MLWTGARGLPVLTVGAGVGLRRTELTVVAPVPIASCMRLQETSSSAPVWRERWTGNC